jgi:hypothetical protein
MDSRGKNAEEIGVIEADGDKHVVGPDRGIEELKEAMLGGLDRCDVTREAFQKGPQLRVAASKPPPISAAEFLAIMVTLWFDPIMDPLINSRVLNPNLVYFKRKQVDDHYPTRAGGEIAAIPISENVLVEVLDLA